MCPQIFIGTDVGRVTPHMFYQACKVSGKNSTQCVEKKVEGTMVIEIELKPENDMTATCDCVGILKERNVDVELRFPEHHAARSKKKSTRCRMVFRANIRTSESLTETLQACSLPIICSKSYHNSQLSSQFCLREYFSLFLSAQPPGIPEICKKSLISCPARGGLELFIIGKNFLKDTLVFFQILQVIRATNPKETDRFTVVWEASVVPDKEHLQLVRFKYVFTTSFKHLNGE